MNPHIILRKPVLIYGYGNPGRQDDGLGCSLVRILEERLSKTDGIDFDCNYQLNIEDGEAISGYSSVVFADASVFGGSEDVFIEKISPSSVNTFSTHSVSPSYVLHISETYFGKSPDVYLLHIRGYEYSFKEGLTEKAMANLMKAADIMISLLS